MVEKIISSAAYQKLRALLVLLAVVFILGQVITLRSEQQKTNQLLQKQLEVQAATAGAMGVKVKNLGLNINGEKN